MQRRLLRERNSKAATKQLHIIDDFAQADRGCWDLVWEQIRMAPGEDSNI